MPKIRLDVLLMERGLAESRAKAHALVMAGQVRVNDQVALKPATAIDPKSTLTVDHGPRFVSRGGEKLDAALEAFAIDVKGLVCADVGASTGGFTDCMLQRGAEKVYAIDVGKGILHWKLRNYARVIVMEETNARHVESLPEQISFAVLRQRLKEEITHLIQNDFQKLVSILYRIDVNERKLKYLLQENVGADAAVIIADLIIERQLEKIKSRSQFSPQQDDSIPDEEKW